jgi:hypothetical protein
MSALSISRNEQFRQFLRYGFSTADSQGSTGEERLVEQTDEFVKPLSHAHQENGRCRSGIHW